MTFCRVVKLVINGEKLIMWQETDIGSELPVTSFDVTHPGLAAVKVGML